MVGKISTSPRYRIDITGTYLLSLGEFGGGGLNSKKLEKMRKNEKKREKIREN